MLGYSAGTYYLTHATPELSIRLLLLKAFQSSSDAVDLAKYQILR